MNSYPIVDFRLSAGTIKGILIKMRLTNGRLHHSPRFPFLVAGHRFHRWSLGAELHPVLPPPALLRSPCIRFLSIGSRFTLHASSPRSVTLTRLRFTSFAVASLREDLHLQECARAGRTKKARPRPGSQAGVSTGKLRVRSATRRCRRARAGSPGRRCSAGSLRTG